PAVSGHDDLRRAQGRVRRAERRRDRGLSRRPSAMPERARVVVAGAGAVGSVVGGMLAARGHDVLLTGRAPHMTEIERSGLAVTGIFGEHASRPRTATDLARADEPADVV